MRTSRYIALFLILAGRAAAEDTEHYFRFTIGQKSELDRLTRIISIDNVVHDTVYAYANQTQWETFQTLGIPGTELPHPSSLYEHKMSDSPLGVLDWDSYPTYQAYLAMMRQYASTYPNICRLDTVGFSIQNRLILALKISDNVNVREDEPQFLYTSSMHGDELVGYILLLRLANHLL
ncbi:MAG TPA: zinc carboxypeptidase, partial [Bacteroidetes bacterium]|nr:zinc carboxypeptidase [Bacteroidota bacterium]